MLLRSVLLANARTRLPFAGVATLYRALQAGSDGTQNNPVFYPTLPFVLIGDSGQEVPEIYREIVARYPSRIMAIYIRNVTPDPSRAERIRALAREVTEAHSELVLASDTGEVAAHALDRRWIDAPSLERVLSDVRSS